MPRLTQTATATTVTEQAVKLTTQQTQKLRTNLKTYNQLKFNRDIIDESMKRHRGAMEDVLEEVGVSSLGIDESKITVVAPVRKKTDFAKLTKFLLKKGVKLSTIQEALAHATTETPQKPYVKVTTAKDTESTEEEE